MNSTDTSPSPAARISDAGRLFANLRAAIDAQKGGTVLEALAEARDASKSERGTAYELLAELHRLVSSAKAEVQAHPELKQELYIGSINAVGHVLNTLIPTNPWEGVVQQLAQPMIGLEFCADQLNRLSDEAVVPSATIADLLEDVNALELSLLEATLEPDLKKLLLQKLGELRQALIDYRVDGAKGLVRASDSALGSLVKHRDAIKKAGKVQQVSDFFGLLIKIDTVVGKVLKYAELAAPVVRGLLGTGADVSDAS